MTEAAALPARPRGRRKIVEGVVVTAPGQKTITVARERRLPHPKYGKYIRRTTTLHVHDEHNEAQVGDRVRVQETRPLSKLKRWRLLAVVGRAPR